jgi:hypothetical protein
LPPTFTPTRRHPRKPFVSRLELVIAGRIRPATTQDVSLEGACFSCELKLARGDALHMDLSGFGMGLRAAVVRHARHEGGHYVIGVEFFETLSATELATLH